MIRVHPPCLLAAALLRLFGRPSPRPARRLPRQLLATVVVEPARVPRETTFDGAVEAMNQSTVSAQTSGRVVELPFDVGDYVEKGAVIVRITDDRAARAAAGSKRRSRRRRHAWPKRSSPSIAPRTSTRSGSSPRRSWTRPPRISTRPERAPNGRAPSRRSARRPRLHGDPRALRRHRGRAPRAARRNRCARQAAHDRPVARAPARPRRHAAAAHRSAAQAPQGARDPAGRPVGRRRGAHPAGRRSGHAHVPRAGRRCRRATTASFRERW